jgi:hypothetical protein
MRRRQPLWEVQTGFLDGTFRSTLFLEERDADRHIEQQLTSLQVASCTKHLVSVIGASGDILREL